MIAVLGAMAVSEWGRTQTMRGHASLVLASLNRARVAVCVADLLSDDVDREDFVAADFIRQNRSMAEGRDDFDRAVVVHGSFIPEIVFPAARIDEALKYAQWLLDRRTESDDHPANFLGSATLRARVKAAFEADAEIRAMCARLI